MIETIWKKNPCRVELPEEWSDFYELVGPTSVEYDDRRRHRRFHARGRAIIEYQSSYYGVLTKDISREGIAFYHEKQLFPAERVTLLLNSGLQTEVSVMRCRRIKKNCYECGVKFMTEVQED